MLCIQINERTWLSRMEYLYYKNILDIVGSRRYESHVLWTQWSEFWNFLDFAAIRLKNVQRYRIISNDMQPISLVSWRCYEFSVLQPTTMDSQHDVNIWQYAEFPALQNFTVHIFSLQCITKFHQRINISYVSERINVRISIVWTRYIDRAMSCMIHIVWPDKKYHILCSIN